MAANTFSDDLRKTGRYDIACCSGIGGRDSQQDSAYWHADDHAVYAVVCDGMGGLKGGARASQTAIALAAEQYKLRYAAEGHPPGMGSDPCWMMDIILAADRALYKLCDSAGVRVGAGSTICSVWVRDNQLYWASAGDSRAYIFRRHEAAQLTEDLNYFHILEQKRRAGNISDADYQKEASQGEALVSFLGLGNLELIDRNTEPLQVYAGDIILLCSDGLYRTIDSGWMNDILAACDRMDEVVNFIHTIIREHGTAEQDNYTCVLIKMNE